MKLLHRTTLLYLIFSALLLALAGLYIYHQMHQLMEEEVNEKLAVEQQRIIRSINNGSTVTSLPPVIEVRPSSMPPHPIQYNDTLLPDPEEGDLEYFRQASTIVSTGEVTIEVITRQVILEPHDYYYSIGIPLALAMLLLFSGLTLLHYFSSRNIWKSFRRNLEIIKRFSARDALPQPLHPSGIREFRELNTVLSEMMMTITREYAGMKEFTANAAHEIQTPLAIISARLEELMQSPRLEEEELGHITVALASVQRLSRMSKGLLLLAKIENRQFPEVRPIALAPVVYQVLEQYERLIQVRQLTVFYDLCEYKVDGNPELVEIMIANLLRNSIEHNLLGGHIRITLEEGMLKISNSGIVQEDLGSHIFTRFAKHGATTPGSGIGLAIVSEICRTYRWTITYAWEHERHNFYIRF